MLISELVLEKNLKSSKQSFRLRKHTIPKPVVRLRSEKPIWSSMLRLRMADNFN